MKCPLLPNRFEKVALIALAAIAGSFPFQAKDVSRNSYEFVQKNTPKVLRPYYTTLYSKSDRSVSNITGVPIHFSKDSIADMVINPTGTTFGIVKTKPKKGFNEASVYSLLNAETCLHKFKNKLFGNPSSLVYLPDGRSLVLATDQGLFFLDLKKYEPTSQIKNIGFIPTMMTVSPNGYYLAATDGKILAVYNLEEKKLRKKMDIGAGINDILFSPDSSDFAVLTDDGVLSLYSTRTFDMRKMIDELGAGIAAAYNFDGKYMAVVTDPANVAVINLLRDSEREYYPNILGGTADVEFITNTSNDIYLAYPMDHNLQMIKLPGLKPYYNKLIAEEVDRRMAEWEKMMPGESMEDYRNRVTAESRKRQRHLFEDEISTNFAGNLLAGAKMSLGSYDRANGVLALDFDSMPTIYLPVPENEAIAFKSADDLIVSDVLYGVMPDDTFEIVYATVTNGANGKSYTYDNRERAALAYMAAEDAVSLEILQQQQMEELKLQEIREKVMQEAKSENIISDHTNITVESRVVPDYDANGNRILNYKVKFSYDVDPEFSAVEDFGPGKYHVAESGAASSMLKIVKDAFEGDFRQYIAKGKKLNVDLRGTADATPIIRGIAYDGGYGEIEDEPVYKDGELTTLTVTTKSGIKENDQLALVRALGVKDFLEKNIENYNDMNTNYRYEVNVSKDKGSSFRRITVEFTFVDAF